MASPQAQCASHLVHVVFDVDAVVDFVRSHFTVTESLDRCGAGYARRVEGEGDTVEQESGCVVDSIHIYPIKSCRGINLSSRGASWELTDTGLAYDREWAIIVPSPLASASTSATEVWRVLVKEVS